MGRLLQLRRQVLLLQFDTAVRHLGRSDAFLSSLDWKLFASLGVSKDLAGTACKYIFIFFSLWSSEVFLSSGDVQSQQSLSDNMAAGLPLLGDCIRPDVFSLALPVPGPLETRGRLVSQDRG